MAFGTEASLLTHSCVADSGIKIPVQGKVFDKGSQQPIAAKLTYRLIVDGKESDPQPVSLDPATGEFSLELAAGAEYRFIAEIDGYEPLIKRVNLSAAEPEDQVTLNFDLKAIPRAPKLVPPDPFGTLVTIVYFKRNSVDLTEESRAELTRLLRLLRANPDIRLAVQGHSDIPGSFNRNMSLSELRVQAVRAFLMAHDVAPYRLPHIAYGNTLMMTAFPEYRKFNNRVEFHWRQ